MTPETLTDIENCCDLVHGASSSHEVAPTVTFGFFAAAFGEVESDAGGCPPELVGKKSEAHR